MKTALILSGHFRCWKDRLYDLNKNYLEKYNPDIFIHTWDDEGWWVPGDNKEDGHLHSKYKNGFRDGCPLVNKDEIISFLKPKGIIVEKFSDRQPYIDNIANKFTNSYARPRNVTSMFYSMFMASTLLKKEMMNTVYDMAIRTRIDIKYHQELPSFDPKGFWLLHHSNHLGTGTGDQLWVSSPEKILDICNIFNEMDVLYKEAGVLCPHIFTLNKLKEMSCNIIPFVLQKSIMHTPHGQYIETEK